MGIYLNNRSTVGLLCVNIVVHDTDQCHASRHYSCPVHVVQIWIHRTGPKAEEDDERQVADGNHIVRYTERSLQPPRPPGQTAVIGFVDLARVEDHKRVGTIQVATETPPEQEPKRK